MIRFTNSEAWWDAIETRLDDRRLVVGLLCLALAGALGISVVCEVGVRIFNTDWSETFGYKLQRDRGAQPFFALWLGITLAPIVQGLVGAALIRVYSHPQQSHRWLRGVAAAIVGWVPMYVAGLTLIVLPGIMIFAIGFLVSCGWWAAGNRRLLGLKYSESPEHVAVSLTIAGGLMLLVSATLPVS